MLEQRQLVGDVALALPGDARVEVRVGLGIAVQAVAGGAGAGLALPGGGVAPGGRLVVQRCDLHRGVVGHGDGGALGVGDRGQREAGNTSNPDQGATTTDKTHAELHTLR